MNGWEEVCRDGDVIGYVLEVAGCELQVVAGESGNGWYFDGTNHFSPEAAMQAAEERAVKAGL